jgi:hypothetical protein
VSESVDLVNDKGGKNTDRQRISPQFVKPKTNDEQRLHQSVREKIQRGEHRATASQLLRSYTQMRKNKIVLIAREFVLAKGLQPGVQRVHFKPQQRAAKGFENAVDSFDGNADTKRVVQQDVGEAFSGHSLQRAISEEELPNMPELTNFYGIYGNGDFGAALAAGEFAGLLTGAEAGEGGACNSAR